MTAAICAVLVVISRAPRPWSTAMASGSMPNASRPALGSCAMPCASPTRSWQRLLSRLPAANLAEHAETDEAGHDQIDRDEVIEKARHKQDEDPRDERQQG